MDNKTFITTLAHNIGSDAACVQSMLDGLCTILREECANANRLAIPGFGSFEGVKHDEEVITDLTTGKRMLLPPSIELKFNAGAMLKKKVKEGDR